MVKHRIAARQTILGFDVRASDRRTIIRLDPALVTVRALPKRAHQGWRYLAEDSAPPDLTKSSAASVASMPEPMRRELRDLGLL